MKDRRHVPLYSIPECARYLGLPVPTVRSWVGKGKAGDGNECRPLVRPEGSYPTALSFTNSIELHVLASLRRKHRIPLPAVRSAVGCLEDAWEDKHPLARRKFVTNGSELFTERLSETLNLSDTRKFAIRTVMESYLERVEYDDAGRAYRLYPYTRGDGRQAPKLIVIDPDVSFGRPVIDGTGVCTRVVAQRVKAGEMMADLADDYLLEPEQIEEAVRYELAC